MKKQKWIVEISVAECWVEDGFDINPDNVSERMRTLLPYARSAGVTARVISAPAPSVIAKLQGYSSVKEYRKRRHII